VPNCRRSWQDSFDCQTNALVAALPEDERVPLHLVHGAALIDQPLSPSRQGFRQISVRQQGYVPVNLTQLVPQNEPAWLVDGLKGIMLAAAS
jgi:hypothetical protein